MIIWIQPVDGRTLRQLTHFTDNRIITDLPAPVMGNDSRLLEQP